MAHAHDIREGMQVIGSDGGMVGRVVGLHGDHIHLEPTAPVHAGDHIVPRSWIARVDDHVHLDREAALVREMWGQSDGPVPAASTTRARVSPATETTTAPGAHPDDYHGMGKSWIVWVIGGLLLLMIIVLGIRGCDYAADDSDMAQPAVEAPDA